MPKDKNFAELHARSTMQKLETVTREDIIPSKKEKKDTTKTEGGQFEENGTEGASSDNEEVESNKKPKKNK